MSSGYRLGAPSAAGFSLVELILALSLSALLMLGLIQVVSAASASARLQRNQAQIQEHARHAVAVLRRAVQSAGFNPEPWNGNQVGPLLADETSDGVSRNSDRLALRTWSDLNCYDNVNPVEDEAGNPRFFIRESVFDLSGDKNLTRRCRYGPSPGELVTQIRRQGLVPGVEAFQVLFGRDSNGDGGADTWVRAGAWDNTESLLGLRFGLLFSSDDQVTKREPRVFRILDTEVTPRADGKLRRKIQFSASFKGRGG